MHAASYPWSYPAQYQSTKKSLLANQLANYSHMLGYLSIENSN